MITRRKFFRFMAGLGAFSTSTAAYGFGVEPLLRLRVTPYRVTPPKWPAGFQLSLCINRAKKGNNIKNHIRKQNHTQYLYASFAIFFILQK